METLINVKLNFQLGAGPRFINPIVVIIRI